jgi:hypothetical protein
LGPSVRGIEYFFGLISLLTFILPSGAKAPLVVMIDSHG